MPLAELIQDEAPFFQTHRLVYQSYPYQMFQKIVQERFVIQNQSSGYTLPGRSIIKSIQQARKLPRGLQFVHIDFAGLQHLVGWERGILYAQFFRPAAHFRAGKQFQGLQLYFSGAIFRQYADVLEYLRKVIEREPGNQVGMRFHVGEGTQEFQSFQRIRQSAYSPALHKHRLAQALYAGFQMQQPFGQTL